MNIFSKTPVPVHGGQLLQIAARYGVAAGSLLDFSANINPAGPPATVLPAIQQALANPATLAAYPDLESGELKQTIANYLAVELENISVANGFVPLLEAALRALNIRRCLLPVPAFSEYRRTLERAKVSVIPYQLESNFSYEPDVLLNTLAENACDAVLFANPQNPSGAVCNAGKSLRLIEMASERGVTILLDEAFIDYCPVKSVTREAAGYLNVILFRSVTKFFAVPGLRVAYAVSHSSTTQKLREAIAPWPVTSLASTAVCAALCDESYAERSRLENEGRRLWMEKEFARLEIVTYPSRTNFLLLRFQAEVDVNWLWERMITEQQIVLRSCANFEGLGSEHLRVAVRSEQENERLIAGLEEVLARR